MIPKKIRNKVYKRLETIKEEFEQQYEIIFDNDNFIIETTGESYSGFISFTDGTMTLNVDIFAWYSIGSGNYPVYLQKYISHIEQLAHEYALEFGEFGSELYENNYDAYLYDDYITIQFRFIYYDKNNKGNGKNKIYCDCFLVDEYNQVINEEIAGNFESTIREVEFKNLKDIDTIFDSMLESLCNINKGVKDGNN